MKKRLLFVIFFFFMIAGSYAQENKLPDMTLTDRQQHPWQLTAQKGKVMFIYLWNGYEPSVSDLAFLEWVEKRYGNRIQYAYITKGAFSGAWRKLFDRFPQLKGLQGETAGKDEEKWSRFMEHYASIVLVDKKGRIYYQNPYQFEEALDQYLKE
ncbi:TlpA family protein disulfide reductase [Chitinophaga nivalis]|uniref:Thioredoxin domain-containing protein n=1 Tax=Chitinophaga nivalis TaxID=2991709 RepID=A0ABT3IM66_9BACT|nr:hypothetical protein [Chitinophaga nivalis]MCW3465253.1 hypothetical protein [Chitinophaga nivalis]MCW3485055.1 hypothetical protein [Chitinophaga nivalis]